MSESEEGRKVWTAIDVHDWMRKAAFAMLVMPRVRVQQYGSSWPAIVHDSNEGYGWNDCVCPRPANCAESTAFERASIWTLLIPDKRDFFIAWYRACQLDDRAPSWTWRRIGGALLWRAPHKSASKDISAALVN